MKKYHKLILSLLTIFIAIPNSFAASITTAPKATATLASTCVLSTSAINFGNITAATNSDTTVFAKATGNIGVLCSNNLNYSIALNLGQGGGFRIIKGAISGETIGYGLCSTPTLLPDNSNCASGGLWFNGNVVSSTGTGLQQNFPTYGFVWKGFYTPDNYTDTVTTTVSF